MITSDFRGVGERGCVRPSVHPCGPIRHDAAHLRLLAHHFGNEHAPRCGAAESPWQVARVGLPPLRERRCDFVSIGSIGGDGGGGIGKVVKVGVTYGGVVCGVRVVHRSYS